MWSVRTNPQLYIRHCRDETAIQLDELCGRNSFKYNWSREGNIPSRKRAHGTYFQYFYSSTPEGTGNRYTTQKYPHPTNL